jgi:hypothetical protein
MASYRYEFNCTDLTSQADVDALERMVEVAQEVSYQVLLRHVGQVELQACFPSYDWSRNPSSLTLANDRCVRFFRSRFSDWPVFYVEHSRIEYVFGKVRPDR